MLSPFRFAGAKNKLLPILKEYLDPLLIKSNVYHEPFIGGGSVGLNIAQRYPNIKLFFNDKDIWTSSFWSVVSGNFNKLQHLLKLLDQPVTIDYFYKLSEQPANDVVEKAYRAIFYNRTCFSGIFIRDANGKIKSSPIGGKEQKSNYKVNCRFNTEKIKKKILYCHSLLKNRTIVSNIDILQYLSQTNNTDVIYLDPPYFVKSHMLYHEFMSDKEHNQLSFSLQKKDNWVLSYDDCSEIRQLYVNNKIIDLSARYCINGKKNTWEKKNELIIIPK